ncbi:hypothetical protein ES332_D09G290600v1 [Gossypium tomentosum]|uniref:Uncharacterized protein n=1 Tax=Gossypium tomentosum TaxID=34277 RepID=A0A5D2JMX1_GOSTO|nr:hypothetical protein ES332_D09G290600v1 [Gossypium tomentosum]
MGLFFRRWMMGYSICDQFWASVKGFFFSVVWGRVVWLFSFSSAGLDWILSCWFFVKGLRPFFIWFGIFPFRLRDFMPWFRLF